MGIGPTHTLAKLCSHGAKHTPSLHGIATTDAYTPGQLDQILHATPVADLWGVGRRLDKRLAAIGIHTARQLRDADPHAIGRRFNVNLARTVHELRGTNAITLGDRDAARTGQIMYSRSFSTPITDPHGMHQVLSIYAQNAARRLRHQHSLAGALWAFAATSWYTQPFHQISRATNLPTPTNDPATIIKTACNLLLDHMLPAQRYVRAGITLTELTPDAAQPMLDPFQPDPRQATIGPLIDHVNNTHGRHAIGLGLAGMTTPPDWQMRRNHLSNRGTTSWAELTPVHATY